MRLLIRCLVLCLVITGAAVPAGARARQADPPASVAALRAEANQAAARYAAAQSVYAELGDEIADLERDVSDLHARLEPLRERITRQAVAVYKGDVALAAVSHFEAAAATLQSDRSAHLVADLAARDIPAIDALLETQQQIRAHQSVLAARRHDQDVKLADLAAQRDQISAELTALAAVIPPKTPHVALPRASRSAGGLGQRLLRNTTPFVCPVDGPLAYSDDFGAPRGGGRRHMGNDLLNPRGTPNVAVVDGTIETRAWAGGGITIFLTADDGTMYVYMHLMQIVGEVPRRVTQGEVVGLTGNTGDARGYHTHFEVHPGGGPAVDPYPLIAANC
jgi:murein DD-endopeptidase MepM/ murein hydrolase activator NlpD